MCAHSQGEELPECSRGPQKAGPLRATASCPQAAFPPGTVTVTWEIAEGQRDGSGHSSELLLTKSNYISWHKTDRTVQLVSPRWSWGAGLREDVGGPSGFHFPP